MKTDLEPHAKVGRIWRRSTLVLVAENGVPWFSYDDGKTWVLQSDKKVKP